MNCSFCQKELGENLKSISNHMRWHYGKMDNASFKGINKGKRNGMWKGEIVKYGPLHDWVKYQLVKPDNCESCGCNKKLDLCNISGEYKRDLSDWKWLCRSCHMTEDGRMNNLSLGRKRLKEKHDAKLS
jgi:hypothetical protein